MKLQQSYKYEMSEANETLLLRISFTVSCYGFEAPPNFMDALHD